MTNNHNDYKNYSTILINLVRKKRNLDSIFQIILKARHYLFLKEKRTNSKISTTTQIDSILYIGVFLLFLFLLNRAIYVLFSSIKR
jgi:hypothetical protein